MLLPCAGVSLVIDIGQSYYQGDNLVGGRKDHLWKMGIVLSKYSTPDYPWIESYSYVPGLLVMPAPLPNRRAGSYAYQADKEIRSNQLTRANRIQILKYKRIRLKKRKR